MRQNIWEYGVLRSIGVTKEQGKRIYMYEAFTVVMSAAILGTLCGAFNAVVLTAELCMFAEIPYAMDVSQPIHLMITLTLFAVPLLPDFHGHYCRLDDHFHRSVGSSHRRQQATNLKNPLRTMLI